MKLIEAEKAKIVTKIALSKIRQRSSEELIAILNEKIKEAAENGEKACVFFWPRVDDFSVLENFLNEVLKSGYETELCYSSPRAFNANGIVVSWGTQLDIDKLFQNPEKNIYR